MTSKMRATDTITARVVKMSSGLEHYISGRGSWTYLQDFLLSRITLNTLAERIDDLKHAEHGKMSLDRSLFLMQSDKFEKGVMHLEGILDELVDEDRDDLINRTVSHEFMNPRVIEVFVKIQNKYNNQNQQENDHGPDSDAP